MRDWPCLAERFGLTFLLSALDYHVIYIRMDCWTNSHQIDTHICLHALSEWLSARDEYEYVEYLGMSG